MNYWYELLKKLQDPVNDPFASEIIVEPYTYSPVSNLGMVGPRPKIKQVITETDDNQPNKRVTTIDYADVGSEEKIPMDQLFTDTGGGGGWNNQGTIGNTGMTSGQIMQGALSDPMYPPTEYAMPMAAGALGLGKLRGFFSNASGKAVEKAAQVADELAQSSGLLKPALTAGGIGVGAVGVGTAMRDVPPAEEDTMVSPDDLMTTYGDNPEKGQQVVEYLSRIPDHLLEFAKGFGSPNPESAPNTVYDPATGQTIAIGPQKSDITETPTQTATNEGLMSDYYNPQLSGSAPFEFLNTNPDSPEGQIVQRAPYIDMRDYRTEGRIQEEARQKESDRIYGNYSYDPAEARKRYEDQMSKIFRNAMLLNVIAQMTGGKSMASAYIASATKRFEMIEAFEDQERLNNIQRGIYYTEDGVYDPPKNKEEAFSRAMRFGAGAELASKISGYAPKEDTRGWTNWYRIVDGKLEETVERVGDKPKGEGWKLGTYSAPSGSGGTETERALDRVDALVGEGNVEGAIQELERVFAYKAAGDITTNQRNRLRDAVDIVWKSIDPSLKIQVPANIKKQEQLPQWEEEQKASGVRGYYRFGDEIGIIQ